MRLLELFSGTGSVGRAFEARGWEVTSLDSNPKASPTICSDILQWDYKAFEPGHFDAVWASPCCTEFSIALKKRPRNLPVGDALVLKTLEVIDYLKPRWWAIENPAPQNPPLHARAAHGQGHVLQVRLPLQEAHGHLAQLALGPLPGALPQGRPLRGLPRNSSPRGRATKGRQGSNSRDQLYSIPPALCDEIAASATLGLNGQGASLQDA